LNGAIVVDRKNQIVIEAAREDQYYATSNQEKAVLVTGPILLLNGERQELKNITFVIKRHPPTCLCIKDDSYILLTIDGRSEDADGMDLLELSDYLLSLECRDAINLDGGGSTTLWLKEEGVYNHPSDKTGERPVSNALVIMKKK
jgi:exopolysaccharide biosynthesis protein